MKLGEAVLDADADSDEPLGGTVLALAYDGAASSVPGVRRRFLGLKTVVFVVVVVKSAFMAAKAHVGHGGAAASPASRWSRIYSFMFSGWKKAV